MSTPTRYVPTFGEFSGYKGMLPGDDDGYGKSYVLYSDYAELEAKIRALGEGQIELAGKLCAEEEAYSALEAQVKILREALKSAAPVINCLDVYGRYLPVKYLIADALSATEPDPSNV